MDAQRKKLIRQMAAKHYNADGGGRRRPPRITEDSPRWNPATMGNHRAGTKYGRGGGAGAYAGTAPHRKKYPADVVAAVGGTLAGREFKKRRRRNPWIGPVPTDRT